MCILIAGIISFNTKVGALFSIIVGIVYFLLKATYKQNIPRIKDIPTLRIKDIITICDTVKEEMGTGGYFNMMVAIEGTIDNPSGDKLGYVKYDAGIVKENLN
jgi:hypothetical protein